MGKRSKFLDRISEAWRALPAPQIKSTPPAVVVLPPVAASSREIILQTTSPAVVEEETELHFRLRRLSRYEGMRFEDIKNGKATLLKPLTVEHAEYPVGFNFIAAFKNEVEADRAFFQRMKDDGAEYVPLAGDLKFSLSDFFVGFYPEPPTDRPSFKIGVGGRSMHAAVKPEVEIDVILGRCDEVIRECDKALRAEMVLPGKSGVSLPAPAVVA